MRLRLQPEASCRNASLLTTSDMAVSSVRNTSCGEAARRDDALPVGEAGVHAQFLGRGDVGKVLAALVGKLHQPVHIERRQRRGRIRMKVGPARHDVLQKSPPRCVGDETQLQAEVLGKLQHGHMSHVAGSGDATTYLLGFFFRHFDKFVDVLHGAFFGGHQNHGLA